MKGLRAHNKHEEYECCVWQVRESWVYLLTFHTLCVHKSALQSVSSATISVRDVVKFARLINEYRWIPIAASGLIRLTLVVACFIMHSIFTRYKKKNSDSSRLIQGIEMRQLGIHLKETVKLPDIVGLLYVGCYRYLGIYALLHNYIVFWNCFLFIFL